MNLTKSDLMNIINSFAKRGKIFSNEAQFQFDLAWELRKQYDVVLLEHLIPKDEKNNKKRYIDILLVDGNECVPIELKYKTTDKETDYEFEEFITKTYNQGAIDEGSYDFLKDISRIEDIVCDEKEVSYQGNKLRAKMGFSIIISNDKRYYKPFSEWCGEKYYNKEKNLYFHNNNGRKYYYWQKFSLAHNTTIGKIAYWIDPETGDVDNTEKHRTKDRQGHIKLRKPYTFEWAPYDVKFINEESAPQFKYMIVEINK